MKPWIFYFIAFIFFIPQGVSAKEAKSPKLIKVGEVAPDFTATDDQGKKITLSQFRGKTVILYFYPKDDTPGCSLEAAQFRDTFPQFEKKDAVILGVSYDDEESHQNFKRKFQLPFYLLVDQDKKISEAYGAQGDFFASRDTIIIGPDGKIQKIFRNVNPSTHAAEVLQELSPEPASATASPQPNPS